LVRGTGLRRSAAVALGLVFFVGLTLLARHPFDRLYAEKGEGR
jgi:hypothetical protein